MVILHYILWVYALLIKSLLNYILHVVFFLDLYGKTNIEAAEIDCVMDMCEDVYEKSSAIFGAGGDADKLVRRKKLSMIALIVSLI